MGPYGPGPGPYEGETLQEKRPIFYTFFNKNNCFLNRYPNEIVVPLNLTETSDGPTSANSR